MNLQEYAVIRKNNPYLSLEEQGELRADIRRLLQDVAPYETWPFSGRELNYLITDFQERLNGFAGYLLDYQGSHDEVFTPITKEIVTFTTTILRLDIPFADAEYRLLEIVEKNNPKQCYDLTLFYPDNESVARFILCHLDRYTYQDGKKIVKTLNNKSLTEISAKKIVLQLYNIMYWYKTTHKLRLIKNKFL